MSRKAITYARVSTDEQRENGYSIQDQTRRLKKYCSENDFEIVKHFNEDYSAKNFDRPEFNNILSLVKSKQIKVDLLVCVKPDRFSRETTEALIMVRTLAQYGIELRFIEGEHNPENPDSYLLYILGFALPHIENIKRSNNTKRGMRQAKREGRWNGKIPSGYQWERSNGKSYIVPDENAKYIQFAFQEFSKGIYSVEEIRQKLKEKGYQCSLNNLHKLLKNVVYIGKLKLEAWKDEPEEIVNGIHEPLISEDLFNQVQHIFEKKSRKLKKKKKLNDDLPLRGYLLCNQCGKKLTGSASKSHTGKRFYYYHCSGGCKERFRADLANQKMVELLYSFKIPNEVLDLYYHIMAKKFENDEKDKHKEIKDLNKKINEVESIINSIDDKFFKDQINIDTYTKAKKRYNSNIENLKFQKNQIEIIDSRFMEYIDYSFPLLKNLDKYYNESNTEIKQKILGSIFPENIIFEKNSFRTHRLNEVVSLLTSNINNLGVYKKKKAVISDSLSLKASPRGVEPLLQE